MTRKDLSDEILRLRCRPMLSSAVSHGLLLVYRRPCTWISGASDRWLTCNFFDPLIIVLTQIRDFRKLPTGGIKLVGTDGRVSTFQCAQ